MTWIGELLRQLRYRLSGAPGGKTSGTACARWRHIPVHGHGGAVSPGTDGMALSMAT